MILKQILFTVNKHTIQYISIQYNTIQYDTFPFVTMIIIYNIDHNVKLQNISLTSER